MIIRAEQMAAFATPMFRREIARQLREKYTSSLQALPDHKLLERVTIACRLGELRGLREGPALSGYVALLILFSPDLDKHPRARAALETPRLSSQQRLQKLITSLEEKDWEQLLSSDPEAAWNNARRRL